MTQSFDRDKKIQTVKELTSFLFHKHYCENDVEAIIELFDDRLSWFGAAENEYNVGTETVSGIFRQFAGMVPKCSIDDEEYDVIDISPDVCICSGRAWIATDPSTNAYLCVHQRITAVFHWVDDTPRCCHIHTELDEDAFQKAIDTMKKNMEQDDISVSVGISWKGSHCNIEKQFDEADRQMYQAKAAYYSSHDTDRRKNSPQ